MTFTEMHRLAVAANLAYVPWDAVNASTPRARVAQALGFEQLSPRWAAEFLGDPSRLAWSIPAAGIQPNDASGFAAQIIETADGKILSIRGTEFRADHWQAFAALVPGPRVDEQTWLDAFGADLDILVPGLAVQQAVSLANYVCRLRAPAGAEVTQIALQLPSATDLLALTTGGMARFLADLWYQPVSTFTAIGLGVLGPQEGLRVVGHSLGGHLAAFALRLFPDLIHDATVFNAPGFDPLGFVGFTEEVVGATSTVLGLRPAPDFKSLGDRVLNVVVESAANDFELSLVPSRLTGADVLPPRTLVRTEVNSHSMDQIADNLAALSLLERLTAGASPATLNALFDASSAQAARSVEGLLGSLSRLFLGPHEFATAVAGSVAYPEGNFEARIEQLDALWALHELASTQPGLRLDSLLDYAPSALALLAYDDAATRFALRALDPYRLVGETTDYARLEDPAAFDEALVSAQELGDRALLYQREMDRRRRDDLGVITDGPDNLQFEDRRNGLRFAVLRTAPDSAPLRDFYPQLVFGGDGPDGERIDGGHAGDRLYAGGGPDVIDGAAGDDTLEGGAGDDLLLGGDGEDRLDGGPGDDVLHGATTQAADDGASDWLVGGPGVDELWAGPGDHVRDRDGRLHVLLGAQWVEVSGQSLRALPGDGAVSLYETANAPQLLLAFNRDSRELRVGAVTVHDFTPGDLDLVLPTPATPPERPLLGGSAAADRLFGEAHAEHIVALAGDDRVLAGDGADWVAGGEGDDVLHGESGDDLIHGEAGRDVLLGEAGDDHLDGGDGADALSGDTGRDLLVGGAGPDVLAGGAGPDLLLGGPGDDLLIGGVSFLEPLPDWQVRRGPAALGPVLRDPRNGELTGFPGLSEASLNRPDDLAGDLLYGEAGADFLIGSAGPDLIDGGPGDDTALGGDGDDVLNGGPGNDHLRGSGGADLIDGGDGDDFLVGAGTGDDGAEPDGGDRLYGGAGKDELQGGPDRDSLFGGNDDDRLFGDADDDWLDGGDGADVLHGGPGNDTLQAGTGHDQAFGGAGADVLEGGEGADFLNGEAGPDRLLGEAGDDRLVGGDGPDRLEGGAGNDRLSGGSGADLLDGGKGDDVLSGGSGNDVYLVHAGDGRDILLDDSGDDGLWLRDLRSPSSLSITERGSALLVHFDASSEIRIEAWRNGAVDWLRLGEGLVLDGAHLLETSRFGRVREVDTEGLQGTPGDDELRIHLAAGSVSGGAGNDRYLLPARGAFSIEEPDAQNTFVFPTGARPDQLHVAGSDTRWQLQLGELAVDFAPDRFARYVFDSGFVLDADDFRALIAREVPAPPRVVEQIGNRGLLGGHAFEFVLPDAAFVDPNPDSALTLHATLANGQALPRWLQFDASAGRFLGIAPSESLLSLTVQVTAVDGDGLSASQRFGLDVVPPFAPGAAAVFSTASLDGGNGMWITPAVEPFATPSTRAVAALGDLDGDGFADLLIGERIVFGQRTRQGATLDLATARGVTLVDAPDWVQGARGLAQFQPLRVDVDGDGRDDVLLDPAATAEDPEPRVLLAHRGHWPATTDFDSLPSLARFEWSPPNPFAGLPTITYGAQSLALRTLLPLGDFNGDGRGDFAISGLLVSEQRPWQGVVFGAAGDTATLDLGAALAGRALALACPPYDGYPHFNPGGAEAASGWGELAPLGDVNGDGLADLGVGSAPYLYTEGRAFGAVVFGRRDQAVLLDLNLLDGVNGFLLAFPEPGTGHARVHQLRAAGDVNGDGNGDILGLDEASGASFLIYGRAAFASALTLGSAEDDEIDASGGEVFAGAGNDVVVVRGGGSTAVDPGAGRNTVIIAATAGAQVQLRGGAGQNEYRVASLSEIDIHLRNASQDRLILPPGVTAATLSLHAGVVRLDTGTQGPRIHLEDLDPARLPDGPSGLGEIVFADGTAIDYARLLAEGFAVEGSPVDDHLRGSSTADRLRAREGADLLEGGAGNDTLEGGAGNDTYVFSAGSGNDVLVDTAGQDLLVLTDVAQVSAIAFRHEALDLVLVRDAGTQIRISNWHGALDARIEGLQLGDAPPLALEALVNRAPHPGEHLPVFRSYFGHPFTLDLPAASMLDPDPLDRLEWHVAARDDALPAGLSFDPATHRLAGQAATAGRLQLTLEATDTFGASSTRDFLLLVEDDAPTLAGSSSDDALVGTRLADHLLGRRGNDSLSGEEGNDVLGGGPGADLLEGGAGDDLLRGGSGDDVLDGGPGDDRYVFERGAGQDKIHDDDAGGHDEILLRGVQPQDIALWREGDALALGLRGTADGLRVEHWFSAPAARIESIRISAGPRLAAGDVDALLDAMARFDPGPALARPLSAAALFALEPVLAATWH